jgi:hypothetical protein
MQHHYRRSRLLLSRVFSPGLFGLALSLTAPPCFAALVPLTGVKQIDAGGRHTCAVLNTGAVKCWGRNDSGQLGNGTNIDSNTAIPVSGLSGVTAVTAGSDHTCALTTSGVKCWGKDEQGQITGKKGTSLAVPTDITGLGSSVKAVSAGDYHTCVHNSGNNAVCWGSVISYPLSPLTFIPSGTVEAIAVGGWHNCAWLTNKTVKCWGHNESGQLGDGSTTQVEFFSAMKEVQGLKDVISIAAGGNTSCAIITGGGLKCWGKSNFGQLTSNAPAATNSLPIDILGLSSGVKAVSISDSYVCALMDTGRVKCWGSNTSGQLGNGQRGGVTPVFTPVDVVGLNNEVVTQITTGAFHACALTQSSQVKCWGEKTGGAIGDGGSVGTITSATSMTLDFALQPVTVVTEGTTTVVPDTCPTGSPTGSRLGLGLNAQGQTVTTKACFKNNLQTPAGPQANFGHFTPPSTATGKVTLSVTVIPDPAHLNQAADTIVIVYRPSLLEAAIYMKTGDTWDTAWDEKLTTLKAANTYPQLPATLTQKIYEADFTSALEGTYTIFVGYRLKKDNTLIYNGKEPLFFTVGP